MPGSVTKHGNPRLRARSGRVAWRLVRFQPQYPPVKKRLAILAKGARATGAARKKAIVAVARHLAVDLWRLHTGHCSAGNSVSPSNNHFPPPRQGLGSGGTVPTT